MRWLVVGLIGFLLGFLFAQANFPQPLFSQGLQTEQGE